MIRYSRKSAGFTLIELAIVLIVVAILLGYTVALFPVQQEIRQYRTANAEMDKIIEAIYAYAQVNGRLPCADNLGAPDGISDPNNGTNCTSWYGLLPAKTLGIGGKYNANNSLLDPWGVPYRYQVTSIDSGAGAGPTGAGVAGGDFVMTLDMKNVTMNLLTPNLQICRFNPTALATDIACTDAAATVAAGIPAVVLSLGKNGGTLPPTSDIQIENTDNTADGITDIVFVKTTRSDTAGAEYDDIVKWISPNTLFSKMIEADKLP